MANVHVAGTLLPVLGSEAAAHTINTGMIGEVVRLTMCNLHTSAVTPRVRFVHNGETAGDEHNVMSPVSGDAAIDPGETREFICQPHLAAGDVIRWSCSVASVLAAQLDVREVGSTGHEKVKTQWLTAALQTLHTVTATKQTTVVCYIFSNTDTSDRTVEVQHVPTGQSAANQYKVVAHTAALALRPGETRVWRWPAMFLPASTKIQAKADVTQKVTFSAGILEEATS